MADAASVEEGDRKGVVSTQTMSADFAALSWVAVPKGFAS